MLPGGTYDFYAVTPALPLGNHDGGRTARCGLRHIGHGQRRRRVHILAVGFAGQ